MKQRIRAFNARCVAMTILVIAAVVATKVGAQTTPPPAPLPPDLGVDTGYVIYDKGPFSLPLGIGFRLPSYTRVDGLVLPWGPMVSFAGGRVQFDPTVTYRSHLGAFDPMLTGLLLLGARTTLEFTAGRGTFSNDRWIRSDLINSAAVIGLGSDARNYFRADRATVELAREFGTPGSTIKPSVGALFENAWSTGPATFSSDGSDPFSFFGGDDSLKIRRINPAIARGHIASALGRAAYDYDKLDVKATVDVRLERAFEAPLYIVAENAGRDFTQITVGARASFPTFGTQRFAFRGHAVATPGHTAPPQRFAYLGGAGTLATVDLLSLGGDNMMFVEGEYYLPLKRPLLPFVGAPVLSARYAAGAAGVGDMPSLIQNIGIAIGVRLIKAEFHIDPSYEKTPFTSRTAFSIGISL